MSDLIERDKVIEYCLKLIDVERKQGSDVMNYGQERINQTDAIIAFVENLTSARLQGEWIPCSERLPEEHEWVGTKQFGTTISDKVHITFDVNGERFVKTLSLQNGELSNYEKRSMDVFYKGWKMLAWMPLPKPWKGADDE